MYVHNTLYGASGPSADTLALQPVLDAIGLQYADKLVVRDKIIVAEGYSELLYLRFFARILRHGEGSNIAPVTGDGKIAIFVPFLISQGISFKLSLDALQVKDKLQDEFGVPNESFFVVQEHLVPRHCSFGR